MDLAFSLDMFWGEYVSRSDDLLTLPQMDLSILGICSLLW